MNTTKVVDVTEQILVTIDKTDIFVCHCILTRRNGPKIIIVKFVQTQTKHLIMGNKKKLIEMDQRLFIHADITPPRGKVMHFIKRKEDVASVTNVNEQIIVYLKSSDKFSFNNFFEIYERDSILFDECIDQRF